MNWKKLVVVVVVVVVVDYKFDLGINEMLVYLHEKAD
jgi:hypothetical protein